MKESATEGVEVRQEAMQRLRNLGRGRATLVPSECLTDYDEELRSAAARVLKVMGDESVLFRFIDALADQEFHVRYGAERAILAFENTRHLKRHMQRFLSHKGEEGVALASMPSEHLENLLTSVRYLSCWARCMTEPEMFVARLRALWAN